MIAIANTLKTSGYDVGVICPRFVGDPVTDCRAGVRVDFYNSPQYFDGIIGHVIEYFFSFFSVFCLSLKIYHRHRFKVLHICNPPDIFGPLALFYRCLGVISIFDIHDLCPELFAVRYKKSRVVDRIMRAAEFLSVKAAHHLIVTSGTAYQRLIDRTGIAENRITLVRNGPQLARFPVPTYSECIKDGLCVGYIGDMNPQDGVENLLLAAHHIRYVVKREDIHFLFIGSGSSFKTLCDLGRKLRLDQSVQFTGRLPPGEAMHLLAATQICALPDSKNAFTDSCVMVKCLEYMALGKSFVSFDLTETRALCDGAAFFVKGSEPRDLAEGLLVLVENPDLRIRLGRTGRRRVEEQLAWSHSHSALLSAYAQALNQPQATVGTIDVGSFGTSGPKDHARIIGDR